jgi:hypothetical protein
MGALSLGCTESIGSYAGDVQLSVSVPSGTAISSLSYRIVDSSGATISGPAAFNGSVASDSAAMDIVVPATPPGEAYVVTLSARAGLVPVGATTSDSESCTATSPQFSVPPGETVSVRLVLVCGNGYSGPPGGPIDVRPVVDDCPSVTSAMISPSGSSMSGAYAVSATASDSDSGDTVTYAWSPAANFADPNAASTTYQCSASGMQSMILAVTDNHQPPCTSTLALPVDCGGGAAATSN